jgi:hypothetical protein
LYIPFETIAKVKWKVEFISSPGTGFLSGGERALEKHKGGAGRKQTLYNSWVARCSHSQLHCKTGRADID